MVMYQLNYVYIWFYSDRPQSFCKPFIHNFFLAQKYLAIISMHEVSSINYLRADDLNFYTFEISQMDGGTEMNA